MFVAMIVFPSMAFADTIEDVVNTKLKDGTSDYDFTYKLSNKDTINLLYKETSYEDLFTNYIKSKINDESYAINISNVGSDSAEYTLNTYSGKFLYILDKTINLTVNSGYSATDEIINYFKEILNGNVVVTALDNNQYNVVFNNVSNIFTVNFTITSESQTNTDALSVSYQSHVQNIGWQDYVSDGELAGTTGQGLRLEAIRIKLLNNNLNGGIVYQTHVQNIGWQDNVNDGELSGTTGQGLRLEAIRIKLTGELADKYDIYYQVHVQNYGWLGWTKNGESAGSAGYGYRLEGIKIQLVSKGDSFDTGSEQAFLEHPPVIYSNAHVQNIGWTGTSSNSTIIGTTGQGLRLEAISLFLSSYGKIGNLEYSNYVQNIGWQNYVSSGAISGTTGQGLRIEATKIRLVGDIADYYDVYYRAHVQGYGWLDWAKNDNPVGSQGQNLRIEALQVVLVKKNQPAPGATSRPFISDSWIIQNGETYHYDINGVMSTGFQTIAGVKYFFNSLGQLRGTNVKHIIDVSSHNGTIDWDALWSSGQVDGVILRVGFGRYSDQLDSKFEYNLAAVKRLGIPYSVYHFSYAETAEDASQEANVFMQWFNQYHLNLSYNVFYDLENWNISSQNKSASTISTNTYHDIATTFINTLNAAGIGASVYSNLNYANSQLSTSQEYIKWIAQYNNTCNYTGSYDGWQFASDDSVVGISGNVDSSVWFK
jgi:uncharacterized protein YjdB